jgi:hypothetical protein
MRASEVEAAHGPTAAKSKKNNGIFTRSGRHAIYFSFRSRRSVGVKDYYYKNSWYSKRCHNANSVLNLDTIVGMGIQQPPKKQVAKQKEKKETTATMVTLYAGFPEERIKPEFHYLDYLHKVFLLLKHGPPHPVKATLKNQRKTQEVPPSNARFQLWKVLIRNNHQPVRPWSMTTNGANRGDKKALPWQPQQPRIPQTFRTGSPNGRLHYGQCMTPTTMNGDLSPNAKIFEYQAGFVTIENRAIPRQPQMATVRW